MNLHQIAAPKKNPIDTRMKGEFSSNVYKLIDSQSIIDYFTDNGFILENTSYAKTRNAEKQGYQKHIMIFTRPDLVIDKGNVLQLLVTNAHDATSSLRLNLGIYRTVCANGLVVGTNFFETRIRHVGNFVELLDESLKQIIHKAPRVVETVQKMKNKIVTFEESQLFMKQAVEARLENVDFIQADLATVDKVRRGHDDKNDLYTFYNRVQEAVIRGGIKYKKNVKIIDADSKLVLNNDGTPQLKIKNGTTREIKNFQRKIELNQVLWDNAVKLAA